MTLFCKLEEIMPAKNVGSTKDFWVRNFAIITDEASKYPQTILCQAILGAVEELDNHKPGDRVELQYALRGRKKDGKYYNCIEVKKINRA
jgi:hypothetical protein